MLIDDKLDANLNLSKGRIVIKYLGKMRKRSEDNDERMGGRVKNSAASEFSLAGTP